jgi:acetyl esterase/lipase
MKLGAVIHTILGAVLSALLPFAGIAGSSQALWPEGEMPDAQAGVAAPFLEWAAEPAASVGSCVIIVAGSDYAAVGDGSELRPLEEKLLANGVTCVWLRHRPSASGLPAYQVAWEDAQRAVRLVRQAAAERGYSADKIGVMGYSAGAHLALLLSASSQTAAYAKVDSVDDIACNVNFAMPISPTGVLADALTVDPVFKFDAKTAATCLFHGGIDTVASPLASTRVYRKVRMVKTSNGVRLADAEIHLDPDRGHELIDADAFERGVEFMRQKGFLGDLPGLVGVFSRFPNDNAQSEAIKIKNIWPDGKTPDYQSAQHQWSGDDANPWIEWHLPKNRTTDAILILYAGGGYNFNKTGDFEVVPIQRYFVEQGLTVVNFHYRSPRPAGLPKHLSAWQDLQRAIRLVRAEAPNKGLDPQKIGLMGHSAGGHLTLMGATTSQTAAYEPIDAIDQLPCNVQFAIALFPAYALTDGIDDYNTNRGDPDWVSLVPDFAFDSDTCPMLFIHGDDDIFATMNSVVCWEKLRSIGIKSEVHTLATAHHDFFQNARPGTGSYHYNERVWDFIQRVTSQIGAAWGAPTFAWTETASGYNCTATAVSTGNPVLATNETVTAVLQATKTATETTPGAGYYTAVFRNMPAEVMATKDVVIPMKDFEIPPGVDISATISPSGDTTGATDTKKIQDHLNVASRVQGTVTLSEGTFYLNAQLVLENGATLAGQGYDKTIVKQTANARCAVIDGGAKIERLTLTGGKVSTMYECGGGACVKDGTISWCCITNNIGSNHYVYGCGVGFSEGQGTVDHCIIANNGATSGVNDYGGGIGALNTAGPVVVDTCLIVGNKLTASGGLGAGIGIKNEHVALVVRNCTISGNVATSRSGGILTEGGWGPITLVNTVVAGNSAGGEANLALGHAITSDSRNCLFGLATEGTSITGVMHGDPAFVDAVNGDYHLAGGSSAIGAGATYAGIGVDLDNVPFAAAPSIGCYEYAGAEPPAPHVHSWGAPTYTWAADNATCTGRAVCTGNSSHVTNETIAAAYVVVTEPTTEATGLGCYTATFTSELFAVQTKDVTIPKLDSEPGPGPGPGPDPADAIQPGASAAATRQTIQDAIDAAAPTQGTVTLGSGLFEIDAQLNVTGGVTLVGQGWEYTIIKRVVNTSAWTAQRCAMLDDGAKLEGVVLTGGAIRAQSENGAGA